MARSKKEQSSTPLAVPQALPVLTLRNSVFFPHQITPLSVGRPSTLAAVEEAVKDEGLIVIVAQTDASIDAPTEKDIYWFGTLAKILKTFTMQDGTRSVLTQG